MQIYIFSKNSVIFWTAHLYQQPQYVIFTLLLLIEWMTSFKWYGGIARGDGAVARGGMALVCSHCLVVLLTCVSMVGSELAFSFHSAVHMQLFQRQDRTAGQEKRRGNVDPAQRAQQAHSFHLFQQQALLNHEINSDASAWIGCNKTIYREGN